MSSQQQSDKLLLTPREQEILNLVALGKTNEEIAHELSLAEKTIKNNLCVIIQKLEVRNRVELAIWVHKHLSSNS